MKQWYNHEQNHASKYSSYKERLRKLAKALKRYLCIGKRFIRSAVARASEVRGTELLHIKTAFVQPEMSNFKTSAFMSKTKRHISGQERFLALFVCGPLSVDKSIRNIDNNQNYLECALKKAKAAGSLF